MALKPKGKDKAKKSEADDAAAEKPRGSRKMLVASALMCFVSLGGGFFLARVAYMQDAEVYEPEYKDEDSDHAAMDDGHGDDHGDGHGKKDDHGKKLRTDITDPLAKDGHDAEHAMALKAKDDHDDGHGKKGGEVADSGLLDFGDIMTNIEGFTPQGAPKNSFLKVSLVLAYRTDEGSGELMEKRQPFMRDLFNGYLRGLSEADVKGMAGVLYIKAELLKRARAAAGNDLPQEILIKDLIVQ